MSLNNLKSALHFVFFQHIKFAVASKCQYPVDSALNDEIYLASHPRLIDFFLLIDYREDRNNDAFYKIYIHAAPPLFSMAE